MRFSASSLAIILVIALAKGVCCMCCVVAPCTLPNHLGALAGTGDAAPKASGLMHHNLPCDDDIVTNTYVMYGSRHLVTPSQ